MAEATKQKPIKQTELTKRLMEQTNLSKKDVAAVINSIVEISKDELGRAGEISLFGLVKLNIVEKPAKPERKGRNPFTGLEQTYPAKPASKAVKARPLKAAKDVVAS